MYLTKWGDRGGVATNKERLLPRPRVSERAGDGEKRKMGRAGDDGMGGKERSKEPKIGKKKMGKRRGPEIDKEIEE
jgi:hypothetical protein